MFIKRIFHKVIFSKTNSKTPWPTYIFSKLTQSPKTQLKFLTNSEIYLLNLLSKWIKGMVLSWDLKSLQWVYCIIVSICLKIVQQQGFYTYGRSDFKSTYYHIERGNHHFDLLRNNFNKQTLLPKHLASKYWYAWMFALVLKNFLKDYVQYGQISVPDTPGCL